VSCPGCAGPRFCATYRVLTVARVELARDANGEITVGPPLDCLAPPPPADERDFYELRCADCGARLDWDVDHRSLYPLIR
jgi:hypothetical protein